MINQKENPWVQTFSGQAFDLVEPTIDMVRASDLAISLARQVRFNGHARVSISVAQHSVLVALIADRLYSKSVFPSSFPPTVAIAWALLHDAAEAYIGDLPVPVRRALIAIERPRLTTAAFEQLDDRISAIIWEWAGITPWIDKNSQHPQFDLMKREEAWKVIKRIDYQMLAFEKLWFVREPEPKPWTALPLPFKFSDFGIDPETPEGFELAGIISRRWTEEEAVHVFLSTIQILSKHDDLFNNITDLHGETRRAEQDAFGSTNPHLLALLSSIQPLTKGFYPSHK